VGLLVFVLSFIAGLGVAAPLFRAVGLYTTATGLVDPEGMLVGSQVPIVVLVAAWLSLSAVIGAWSHASWLSADRASAMRAGVMTGVSSAVIVTALMWLSTFGPAPLAAVGIVGVRLFGLMGPAVLAALVTKRQRAKRKAKPAAGSTLIDR